MVLGLKLLAWCCLSTLWHAVMPSSHWRMGDLRYTHQLTRHTNRDSHCQSTASATPLLQVNCQKCKRKRWKGRKRKKWCSRLPPSFFLSLTHSPCSSIPSSSTCPRLQEVPSSSFPATPLTSTRRTRPGSLISVQAPLLLDAALEIPLHPPPLALPSYPNLSLHLWQAFNFLSHSPRISSFSAFQHGSTYIWNYNIYLQTLNPTLNV